MLEWTLRHLDLIAFLPGATEPPAETLAPARALFDQITGMPFPAALSDKDALLVGTGRRAATDAERSTMGELAGKLPLVLG